MPRKSIDYSKTIIYKIVCNDLNVKNCYVGSTTNFNVRKRHHKMRSIEISFESDIKLYNIIRANGGWNNWSMIEIEKYPCNDGNESRAREMYYYQLFKSDLNMRVPLKYC
jgi:hypothetical protein